MQGYNTCFYHTHTCIHTCTEYIPHKTLNIRYFKKKRTTNRNKTKRSPFNPEPTHVNIWGIELNTRWHSACVCGGPSARQWANSVIRTGSIWRPSIFSCVTKQTGESWLNSSLKTRPVCQRTSRLEPVRREEPGPKSRFLFFLFFLSIRSQNICWTFVFVMSFFFLSQMIYLLFSTL